MKTKVNFRIALLLSLFLGWCAADRFYMKQYGLATIKILTLSGLFWWWIIDCFLIANEKIDGIEFIHT